MCHESKNNAKRQFSIFRFFIWHKTSLSTSLTRWSNWLNWMCQRDILIMFLYQKKCSQNLIQASYLCLLPNPSFVWNMPILMLKRVWWFASRFQRILDISTKQISSVKQKIKELFASARGRFELIVCTIFFTFKSFIWVKYSLLNHFDVQLTFFANYHITFIFLILYGSSIIYWSNHAGSIT